MFLEVWMMVVLALAFGVCALWNRYAGIELGAAATLEILHNEKKIIVSMDGTVKPWSPATERLERKTFGE